ncbi:MAG: GNAT family N-acetyltransferase [Rhodothermales bacterium]
MSPPSVVETKRLRLRPPVVEDADFVYGEYAQDEAVGRYMMWPRHTDVAQTRRFLERCEAVWAAQSAFPWLMERREDGKPLGMVEMQIKDFRVNIGYVLAKAYWGHGYMTEAVAALRDWALDQPEIYRFWSFCDVENKASARVMEKVGMQREGILRRWVLHPNVSDEPRDCYCYAVVK